MFHVEQFHIYMRKLSNISGNILDVINKRIYQGEIYIENGRIIDIVEKPVNSKRFITPGLIDSHIHIESSMLTPQNFAEVVIRHGTIALVADPHEIANVLGIEGVQYMIDNAKMAPAKFFFGAPSCVPATSFEDNGGEISPSEIEELFTKGQVHFLSEMMNYPGVIYKDPLVLKKIEIANKFKAKIDGHAPGLRGVDLLEYVNAGIETDHECITLNEAIEKINIGMKILVREGSAAKNFNALFPLIDQYPNQIMFCTDDLHPDDLIRGHINLIVKRAIDKGADIFNVFRACTFNPISHYNLNIGILNIGDSADMVVFFNQEDMEIEKTIINGNIIYQAGENIWSAGEQNVINNFKADKINLASLQIADKGKLIKIIQAYDGELNTGVIIDKPNSFNKNLQSDISKDFLKICLVCRFKKLPPALGFINGFGIKRGAIASSVAHDSHNIIGIGANDQHLAEVVNWIIDHNGGIAVHDGNIIKGIPLPIAGIISDNKAEHIAKLYAELNRMIQLMGSELTSPFMTLSFMALLVIPEIKLSNRGLFDSNTFSLTDLYVF